MEAPVHVLHMPKAEARKLAIKELERVDSANVSTTTRPSFPAVSSSEWRLRARSP
jgi:ABC-type histidine transport system ATPase subunit